MPEEVSRSSPSPAGGRTPCKPPGTFPSWISGYFGLLFPSPPHIPTHEGTDNFLHPRVTLLLPVPGVNKPS